MERTLVAFTSILVSAGLAQAAHPQQVVKAEGTVRQREFVSTQARHLDNGDRVFARQVLPARGASASAVAATRTIYLDRDAIVLWPGGNDNDATSGVSSIVTQPTQLGGWDIDDDTWAETVACVQDIYRPFNVKVTDEDPGDEPHLEAHFGGSPVDVGLPDNVAGVSPFTEDCAIIESSVVFTFTDVMPDNARTMCEVMAQEIAHSYGLDHEMLASDPMTYLSYDGDRTFKNQAAACGEYGNRLCGINGNMCRQSQNSVALLTQRLGARGGATPPMDPPDDGKQSTGSPHIEGGGCSSTRGGASWLVVLGALAFARKRRIGYRAQERSPRSRA